MSDLWFNIRFGKYHLSLSNTWKVRFVKNNYWYNYPEIYKAAGRFRVYCAFGKHFL